MIEELKQILLIIKDLPHMVMWVLAGLLLYKVVVVGSVYGVIRLAIIKLYDYNVGPKNVVYDFRGMLFSSLVERKLLGLLMQVKGTEPFYINEEQVSELENAWKAYKEKSKV